MGFRASCRLEFFIKSKCLSLRLLTQGVKVCNALFLLSILDYLLFLQALIALKDEYFISQDYDFSVAFEFLKAHSIQALKHCVMQFRETLFFCVLFSLFPFFLFTVFWYHVISLDFTLSWKSCQVGRQEHIKAICSFVISIIYLFVGPLSALKCGWSRTQVQE